MNRDPTNPAPAEKALLSALSTAGQSGARSFEPQAAFPLVGLLKPTGRPLEARAVLALALDGFTPTSELPAIADAQALLAELDAP